VKLTVQLKLDPSPADADSLRRTLRAANAAADSISRRAFESGTFRQFDLHHLVYREVRERFGLSAQMTVRAISKVADAYKLDRDRRRTFRPHGAVAYDDRILCFKPGDSVSICTVDGRRTIGFVCGAHQRLLLPFRRGQADLVMRDGTFYLYCVVEVEEPALDDAVDVIGTDLGLANLATTSDGKFFAGDEVEAVRSRRTRERQSLQKRASAMKNAGVRPKNVRRKLKSLAGRQARFQRDTNHCISKKLVANAKDTKRAIALEDLKGIRGRVRFGRDLRARLGNWAFAQLAFFVVYKAARAGVRTDFVDPRHTSQTCHECGHRERANRTSQAQFRCRRCGHTAHADVNAALNIRARAAVNRPKVAERHLVSPTA
jgi:IS605 OrfB family transposase